MPGSQAIPGSLARCRLHPPLSAPFPRPRNALHPSSPPRPPPHPHPPHHLRPAHTQVWLRACLDYGPRHMLARLTADLLRCGGPEAQAAFGPAAGGAAPEQVAAAMVADREGLVRANLVDSAVSWMVGQGRMAELGGLLSGLDKVRRWRWWWWWLGGGRSRERVQVVQG